MRWFLMAVLMANGVAYFWLSSAQGRRLSEEDRPPGVYVRPYNTLALVKEVDAGGGEAGTAIRQNCLLLGPVSKQSKAKELVLALAEGGVLALPRMVVDGTSTGYWLYIQSPETEAERAEMLVALKRADIDFFVFHDGEMKGGVSLGFFSGYANAVARQQEIRAQGFPLDIVSTSSVNRTYWLEIDEIFERRVIEKFWSALTLGSLTGEIETRPCSLARKVLKELN